MAVMVCAERGAEANGASAVSQGHEDYHSFGLR
jgi:hypothetical protein